MTSTPVVLGLDFGGTKIAAAVCEPSGRQLASAVVTSQAELGARATFEYGVHTARELLESAAPGAELAAVGAATFGIPFDDRVELAPAIDGWATLPFGQSLRAAFPGIPVALANDVKAAAAAEARWGSLAGCDTAVYLNLGTGLAAAVVVAGQVLAGSHRAAGEIGYNLRTAEDVGSGLSHRILLEDMVSGQALARRATSSGGGMDLLSAAEVFGASECDAGLDALIGDFVNELAFHLTNLAILVDPVRIAVGGGIVRSWDRIGPGLEAALQAGVPFPPELVLAHFPNDASLLGAVALAVDALPWNSRHDGSLTSAGRSHATTSTSNQA